MESLRQLVAPLVPDPSRVPERDICAVTCDSRQATSGCLFIAISGTAAEGHQFIPEAARKGAVAVVYEKAEFSELIPSEVAAVKVDSSRRAAAIIADRFWHHPTGDVNVVAVTGTNAKTTSVHLLESVFKAGGYATGMIGTLGRRLRDETVAADRTTPDAVELQSLLARMRDEGVTHVSMELSSHALDLDRAWGCAFAGALFTNLSHEHMDWHHDLASYRRSKTRLFTEYADLARPEREMVGAINVDDEAGRLILAEARCPIVTFGLGEDAQVRARDVEGDARGSRFTLVTPEAAAPVALKLVGLFNVMNALGAAACAHGLGFSLEAIVGGLEDLTTIPGRFEPVDRGQSFAVIVDYAHTPEAMANALQAARALRPARVICVFGAGGERDRQKRPLMSRVSTELADLTFITSDNPRSEDPLAIIEEIRAGARPGWYRIEPDRREAIRLALREAQAGDIVLICGKGHEDYMEFEDHRRVHFDDREVAAEVLEQMSC